MGPAASVPPDCGVFERVVFALQRPTLSLPNLHGSPDMEVLILLESPLAYLSVYLIPKKP